MDICPTTDAFSCLRFTSRYNGNILEALVHISFLKLRKGPPLKVTFPREDTRPCHKVAPSLQASQVFGMRDERPITPLTTRQLVMGSFVATPLWVRWNNVHLA